MQDAKEEVRAKLNIEDVIGEYVELKRAGRHFKGLSPFSGEKSPSFFVTPDKHIWHDFSSNKGGDMFSFVMEVEGMDFRQALEHLARKAGVDLSQYQSKGSQEMARRKKRLLEANDLAANYYQHSLLKNQHALEYVFKKRGLSKQIVQDFRIGYAPTTGNALVQFLRRKGFGLQELFDAGLLNRYDSDMFRGRMMVPLMDPSGQVIGFTARIIADDPNAPKYLNTPQTALYDKGRHVFGLSQAKEAIRANDYAVIVEGNLDVVSSHQVNIKGVVATAGTAMTEYHLRALRRLTGNVRLAFDGDKAGIAATERAIPIASEVGVELTIISLPDGAKDPDELIQQDVSLWQKAIDNAKPAVDWILDQYNKREDITTGSGVRAFTTAALDVVRGLNDPIEREHYEKKIASMTSSTLKAVHAKLEQGEVQVAPKELKPVQIQPQNIKPQFDHIDTLLGLALMNAEARTLFAQTDPTIFEGDHRQAIVRYVAKTPGSVTDAPPELQSFSDYVTIVLLRAENRYGTWDDKDQTIEAAKLLRKYENEYQIQSVTAKKQAAAARGDDAEVARLEKEEYLLIKQKHSIRR
ncbi:MAG TPA: DNA primase [Candidatus Saccharimonadales bacterium]|nr:DNA primase [Candidatus Saccharimonadales bacterium]